MRYTAPRGTNDILPETSWKWQAVENLFRQTCHLAGYREIRTPVFEETDLFTRSIGEVTDIVSKEMYSFQDRSGRELTLRPEGTAPVVRAWVEHSLGASGLPTKLYYVGSNFRYERPQKGRYRQFHQFGVEAIGSEDPTLDAEVIALAATFLTRAGAAPFSLRINSVGTPQSRAVYGDALKASTLPYLDKLCPSCQTRFEKNPLRMLDCKEEKCRELTRDVPAIADYLDEDSAGHFVAVKECLEALGIPFAIDPRLVRGFDYYTRTAFEFTVDALGAQDAVCGGGRYDNLVEEIGGPATPAVGFGMGIERLLLVLEKRAGNFGCEPKPTVFVVRAGEGAQAAGLALAADLWREDIACEVDFGARSMKAQMKKAGKSGARLAIILGDDEMATGQVTVKDLLSPKDQWRMPRKGIAGMIKDYLETSEASAMAQVSHT